MKDFVDGHYGMLDDERFFPFVQETVQHKMKRQIVKTRVKISGYMTLDIPMWRINQ